MRIYVFLAAVLLLAWGIMQREYLAVMRKASTICLECIGLG